VISGEGVATDDSTIASIVDWVIPTNLKEVRGLLGDEGMTPRSSILAYLVPAKEEARSKDT
jgi:hypothetical protein